MPDDIEAMIPKAPIVPDACFQTAICHDLLLREKLFWRSSFRVRLSLLSPRLALETRSTCFQPHGATIFCSVKLLSETRCLNTKKTRLKFLISRSYQSRDTSGRMTASLSGAHLIAIGTNDVAISARENFRSRTCLAAKRRTGRAKTRARLLRAFSHRKCKASVTSRDDLC